MAAEEAAVAVIEEATEGIAESLEEQFGLHIEPSAGFDSARKAVQQLYVVLGQLEKSKVNTNVEESSEAFSNGSYELQQQLLLLRRSHRAMMKMAEMGVVQEVAARRAADAEYALLETKKYESACCRAAARRCRALPTPQLNKLRSFLEGFEEEDETEELDATNAEGDATKSRLAVQLEAERLERTRLATELEGLEARHREALEAFVQRERLGAELTAKLTEVDRALEPVCNLLALRPGQATSDQASKLPAPLRLVNSKFQAIASLGPEAGVTVTIEESGTPTIELSSTKSSEDASEAPEKRRKIEVSELVYIISVEIKQVDGPQACKLRFANPSQSIITVASEGFGGETLLEDLWLEDDGRHSVLLSQLPSAELAKASTWRPYAWAQVLAGLREDALTAVPALFATSGVTANDVVLRVRNKLKGTAPASSA